MPNQNYLWHTIAHFILNRGPPGVLTWYCGSWVRRLSSLNSSWMLVTSARVLSAVHRGGWAVPFPMLTSENGIFEGVLKAGINLDPRSFLKQREETELQVVTASSVCSIQTAVQQKKKKKKKTTVRKPLMDWLTAFSKKSWSPVRW